MKHQQNIQRIRLAIIKELQNCIPAAMPKVCDAIQTEKGYEQIEHECLKICLRERITPNQALPLLESQLNDI